MHQYFIEFQFMSQSGARELFRIAALEARTQLLKTDDSLRIGHNNKTTKLNNNHDLELYLYRLFTLTGLYGQYDIQGAWTITLFPSTGPNGRYFTINIGTHEAALSDASFKAKQTRRCVSFFISASREPPPGFLVSLLYGKICS
jgi:hypothetical protein